MKVCSRCKKEQSLDQFIPRKDRGNRPHSWCDECRKSRFDAVLKSRRNKQNIVAEHKRERGCLVCGLNEPVALDFHHTDPSVKDSTISNLFANNASIETIFKEIEKCIILCANHHRMYHAGIIVL